MPLALVARATAIVISATLVSPALAAGGRTFVSGKGADSGACTVTAPCRSFTYALSQTKAAGEVVVLDSAGYGTLTITQSVSISNPGGVEAGITVPSGGTGITINAPNANVDLRGLLIDGQGIGAIGIDVQNAQHVDISDAVVRNFTIFGISNGAGQVVITNALISNSVVGVQFSDTSCCSALIGSIVTNNSDCGVCVRTFKGSDSTSVLIEKSTLFDNTNGITVGGYATISHVTSFGNSAADINANRLLVLDSSKIGKIKNDGVFYSYGNNAVATLSGNGPTSLPLK